MVRQGALLLLQRRGAAPWRLQALGYHERFRRVFTQIAFQWRSMAVQCKNFEHFLRDFSHNKALQVSTTPLCVKSFRKMMATANQSSFSADFAEESPFCCVYGIFHHKHSAVSRESLRWNRPRRACIEVSTANSAGKPTKRNRITVVSDSTNRRKCCNS